MAVLLSLSLSLSPCHHRSNRFPQVTLEAETVNVGAVRLYEKLGFVRDKKLPRYYLKGTDAWRLKLWLDRPEAPAEAGAPDASCSVPG